MWKEILGIEKKPNNLAEIIVPRRTFSDVVLPEETRQSLYEALTQIEKQRLIFSQWGLGERHPTGKGLAFNFAGPPGTGKTICAEAIASTLGKRLLRVRYAEIESCWAGDTSKNIRSVFRESRSLDAILFFDEADSLACRRFSNVQMGYEREANQSVNVLLTELEEHEGVIIFATNMASNFDPAFERRIRTHILFRIPDAAARERIWKVQLHPEKTPLGKDVNFRELAERYEVSGGDIRNAVLKAAQIAAAEPGPDETKRILQRHFMQAIEQVRAAKGVMHQCVGDEADTRSPMEVAMEAVSRRMEAVDQDLGACRTELELLTQGHSSLESRLDEEHARTSDELANLQAGMECIREDALAGAERHTVALETWRSDQEGRLTKLIDRLETYEHRLGRVTVIALPRPIAMLVALAALALAVLGGRFLP